MTKQSRQILATKSLTDRKYEDLRDKAAQLLRRWETQPFHDDDELSARLQCARELREAFNIP